MVLHFTLPVAWVECINNYFVCVSVCYHLSQRLQDITIYKLLIDETRCEKDFHVKTLCCEDILYSWSMVEMLWQRIHEIFIYYIVLSC